MTIHIAKWLFYFLCGGVAGIFVERMRWLYRISKLQQEGGDTTSQPPSENESQ